MSLNITQSLFDLDSKIIKENDNDPFSAYVNQSRLSTYYQDNPWPTLTFTNQFGVRPIGGPINYMQPPGHRPGNLAKKVPVAANDIDERGNEAVSISPLKRNGIMVPSNMVNFPSR